LLTASGWAAAPVVRNKLGLDSRVCGNSARLIKLGESGRRPKCAAANISVRKCCAGQINSGICQCVISDSVVEVKIRINLDSKLAQIICLTTETHIVKIVQTQGKYSVKWWLNGPGSERDETGITKDRCWIGERGIGGAGNILGGRRYLEVADLRILIKRAGEAGVVDDKIADADAFGSTGLTTVGLTLKG
jgi:hypothetical protein